MDLPERMREAVWLWAQGLDSPAIGKRLGISPNTARVHVHHMRQTTGGGLRRTNRNTLRGQDRQLPGFAPARHAGRCAQASAATARWPRGGRGVRRRLRLVTAALERRSGALCELSP